MKHEAVVTVIDDDDLPVTIAYAKDYAGITGDEDDDLIRQLILGAIDFFQGHTGHQLMEATCVQKWDGFPERLELDWSPVISVASITYYDVNGTLTTVDDDDYWTTLESRPPAIVPVYGTSWPDTQCGRPESVTVQYVAGYADVDDINQGIRTAIMQLVAHWNKRRGPVVAEGGIPKDVPYTLRDLMALHTRRGYR